MKLLRVLPKNCRKKIVINQLQRFRKSKLRKQMLKSRRDGLVISRIVRERAEKSIAEAQKPQKSKAEAHLAAYALGEAKLELKSAEAQDRRTRDFASTKKERTKLRKFWELEKK